MDAFIYLDQNTLSDLRDRKVNETENQTCQVLRQVLGAPNIQVVYSYVHLAEINQISVEKYRQEHIVLLEQLAAKYIEPLSKNLSNKTANFVWKDYLETQAQNEELGIAEVLNASELSARKLSGLPIAESFEELGDIAKASLKTLLDSCATQLKDINLDELEEPLRRHFLNMKEQLPALRAKSQSLETIAVPEGQKLGPTPFRECSDIQKLGVMQLPSHEVVNTIENMFKRENSNFDWRSYFEDTPQNNISRAYNLMNWAGYYADDFDRVKKKHDRFRASINDMQHAMMAFGATFLLSSDKAFCMKAKSCYEYVGATTIVCSPDTFLRNHCKFV